MFNKIIPKKPIVCNNWKVKIKVKQLHPILKIMKNSRSNISKQNNTHSIYVNYAKPEKIKKYN